MPEASASDLDALQERVARLEQERDQALAVNAALHRRMVATSRNVRQPLQAMQVLVHLLAERSGTAESTQIAGQLQQAVKSATGLLNGLLDPPDLTPDPVLPAAAVALSGQEDGAGPVVVVVEDDQLQLMALRMLLRGWGYRVFAVPTVEAAETVVESGVRPDLVLTDFHLRGSANGIEAISRIRRKIGSPLAGFLLTGDTDPEHVVKTRRAGCGLLYKPFDPERLRKALAQALGAQ